MKVLGWFKAAAATPEFLNQLAKILRDGDPEARAAAAKGMMPIRGSDANWDAAVAFGLGKLGCVSPNGPRASWAANWPGAVRAAGRMMEFAVNRVDRWLNERVYGYGMHRTGVDVRGDAQELASTFAARDYELPFASGDVVRIAIESQDDPATDTKARTKEARVRVFHVFPEDEGESVIWSRPLHEVKALCVEGPGGRSDLPVLVREPGRGRNDTKTLVGGAQVMSLGEDTDGCLLITLPPTAQSMQCDLENGESVEVKGLNRVSFRGCPCGTADCPRDHTIAGWNEALPLRRFLRQAVSGPKIPPETKSLIQGMYVPTLIASPQGRHGRLTLAGFVTYMQDGQRTFESDWFVLTDFFGREFWVECKRIVAGDKEGGKKGGKKDRLVRIPGGLEAKSDAQFALTSIRTRFAVECGSAECFVFVPDGHKTKHKTKADAVQCVKDFCNGDRQERFCTDPNQCRLTEEEWDDHGKACYLDHETVHRPSLCRDACRAAPPVDNGEHCDLSARPTAVWVGTDGVNVGPEPLDGVSAPQGDGDG